MAIVGLGQLTGLRARRNLSTSATTSGACLGPIYDGAAFASKRPNSSARRANLFDRPCGATRNERTGPKIRNRRGLCGGVEGDGVAESVQSADVVAYCALRADAVRVVVWAQIVEHGVGFG